MNIVHLTGGMDSTLFSNAKRKITVKSVEKSYGKILAEFDKTALSWEKKTDVEAVPLNRAMYINSCSGAEFKTMVMDFAGAVGGAVGAKTCYIEHYSDGDIYMFFLADDTTIIAAVLTYTESRYVFNIHAGDVLSESMVKNIFGASIEIEFEKTTQLEYFEHTTTTLVKVGSYFNETIKFDSFFDRYTPTRTFNLMRSLGTNHPKFLKEHKQLNGWTTIGHSLGYSGKSEKVVNSVLDYLMFLFIDQATDEEIYTGLEIVKIPNKFVKYAKSSNVDCYTMLYKKKGASQWFYTSYLIINDKSNKEIVIDRLANEVISNEDNLPVGTDPVEPDVKEMDVIEAVPHPTNTYYHSEPCGKDCGRVEEAFTDSVKVSDSVIFSSEGLHKGFIVVSAYETSFGKLIKTDTVRKELLRFLTETEATNMNYEFTFSNSSTDKSLDKRLVFITGCCEAERALPVWDYPIIIENLKHERIVVTDLRKYMKQLTEQPLSVTVEAKDKSSVKLLAMLAILTLEFDNGNTGVLGNYNKAIVTAYTMLIASTINNLIPLNPAERLDIEIATAYFASYLLLDTDDENQQENIIARLNTMRFTIPPVRGLVQEVVSKLQPPTRDITGLVETLKKVMPEQKQMFITRELIVNTMAGQWYGTNGTPMLIIALEHMPSWISLMFSAVSDTTFKRAKLSTSLERFTKQIGTPELIKGLDNYLSEHIHQF